MHTKITYVTKFGEKKKGRGEILGQKRKFDRSPKYTCMDQNFCSCLNYELSFSLDQQSISFKHPDWSVTLLKEIHTLHALWDTVFQNWWQKYCFGLQPRHCLEIFQSWHIVDYNLWFNWICLEFWGSELLVYKATVMKESKTEIWKSWEILLDDEELPWCLHDSLLMDWPQIPRSKKIYKKRVNSSHLVTLILVIW
mgnify:CR=1 FL=1